MVLTPQIYGLKEERRLITALFADIVGFSSLSERLDPEDLRDLTKGLLNQLATIVQEEGGYVDKFLGDGLMALFGAPTSHEDDPCRAIQAALKMQGLVKRDPTLQLRVGIDTGEAIIGAMGKDDYTAIGDTVNIAQRLQEIAWPGTIVISKATQRLARLNFRFQRLELTQLRGKKDLIQPYEVDLRGKKTCPSCHTIYWQTERTC